MARHYGKEVIYLKIWKGAILGKNTYLKKGHKLDIKYLKIPGQFLQNRTIFDAILVKNGSSIFGAKLLQIGAKRDTSLAYEDCLPCKGVPVGDRTCTWVRHQESRLDMPITNVSREAVAEPRH